MPTAAIRMGDGYVVHSCADCEVEVPTGSRTIAHRFYVVNTEAFHFVLVTDFFMQHFEYLFHLIRALRRRDVRIASGWCQDSVRMTSGWHQDGVRMASGWRQEDVRMRQDRRQNAVWMMGSLASGWRLVASGCDVLNIFEKALRQEMPKIVFQKKNIFAFWHNDGLSE